jgi:hypothetical protein
MCWENTSASPEQRSQCRDAWLAHMDVITKQYPMHWPIGVVDSVYQEARYWANLPYSEFVAQWNSSRPPMGTDSGGAVWQSSLPAIGAVSMANPGPGPEDLIALGGLCIAAIWAITANARAITLLNRPIINFGTSSGTMTQTFPLVLESTNFDWQTMERNAADEIERALPPGTVKLLYRGKALVNILNTTNLHENLLWLSETPYYVTIYAHTDAAAERDTAAIAIYGILEAVLTALITTGNVKPRFAGGLEYGFDPIARASLAGPVVIPIPDSFRG